MKNQLVLEPDNPYVMALRDKMSVRFAATLELLSPSCPAPLSTQYASYVRSLPECANWPDDMVVADTMRAMALTRTVFDEGYDNDRCFGWAIEHGEFWAPIQVGMDRLGRLCLGDGNRRAIAQLLSGRPVLAKVFWRDPEWAAAVAAIARPGAWLYQSHPHPEFAGQPVGRTDTERYSLVGSALAGRGVRRVVDIGSCYGTGTIAMARQGIPAVIGLEHSVSAALVQESQFSLYSTEHGIRSICGGIDMLPAGADAYVGLSVWHHLAQTIESLDAWVAKVRAAKYQVIELPESTSSLWTEPFVQATGLPTTELPSFILSRFMQVGYVIEETLYRDDVYNGRETILLSRGAK